MHRDWHTGIDHANAQATFSLYDHREGLPLSYYPVQRRSARRPRARREPAAGDGLMARSSRAVSASRFRPQNMDDYYYAMAYADMTGDAVRPSLELMWRDGLPRWR